MDFLPAEPACGPILLVTTCWWPALARCAHLLAMNGCEVAVLCPRDHAAQLVPGIRLFHQRALRPLKTISTAIAACRPAMIIPGDDRAVLLLHRLHRVGSFAERQLIENSLGAPESYPISASRVALLELARQLGIAVPATARVTSAGALNHWIAQNPSPWVLKIDGSWGGMGVRVIATAGDARAMFQALRRQSSLFTAIKRLIIFQDPYWLTDWWRRRQPEISAQGFVRGHPGDLAMLCWKGQILAVIAAESVACLGENRPSTIVRITDHPDFIAAAHKLAAELQLTGLYGLDFMIDDATGQAFLIELNPRLTALANIRAGSSRDLIGALVTRFTGETRMAAPNIGPGDLVAHFPISRQSEIKDPSYSAAYQDAPWEEPALMAAMLRPSWPERRWLARLAASYVAFKSRRMVCGETAHK